MTLAKRFLGLLIHLAILAASLPAFAGEWKFTWQTRADYGIANCEQLGLSPEVTKFCKEGLVNWTGTPLPDPQHAFFTVSEIPLTLTERPGAYEREDFYWGIGHFLSAHNIFERGFPGVLIKANGTQIRFDYGAALRDIATLDRMDLTSPSGRVIPLFRVSHTRNGQVFPVLSEVTNADGGACLEAERVLGVRFRCEDLVLGDLQPDRLATTVNLKLEELDPRLFESIKNLYAAIEQSQQDVLARAESLQNLPAQLAALDTLPGEVERLLENGVDGVTVEKLNELLARYPDLPDEARRALVDVVDAAKASIEELRATLERTNREFAESVDRTVNLIFQNMSSTGFDPNDPSSATIGIGFGGFPDIDVPTVSSDGFDPAHDQYAAYASTVIEQLRKFVGPAGVTDRLQFARKVRIWRANMKAVEAAILKNRVSQAEFGAFLQARNRVRDYLRTYLDDQGWYTDSPVPVQARAAVDGTYIRLFGDSGEQLKEALNSWEGGLQLTRQQLMLTETITAMGSGYSLAAEQLFEMASEVAEAWSTVAEITAMVTRVGVGFVPYVGAAVDICEVVTRRAFCLEGGRELTDEEVFYSAVMFPLGLPSFWRGAKNFIRGFGAVIKEETIAVLRYDQTAEKLRRVRRINLKVVEKYRNIRGAVSTLSDFEARTAIALSNEHTLLYVGDEAVAKTLQLTGAGVSKADFVSLTSSNKFWITEAKGVTEGAADVNRARIQLRTVAERLRELYPEIEVGGVELAVPRGAALDGNYSVANGYIISGATGQPVTIAGLLMRIRYI